MSNPKMVTRSEIVRAGKRLWEKGLFPTGYSIRKEIGRGCSRRFGRVWEEYRTRCERRSAGMAFEPFEVEIRYAQLQARLLRRQAVELRRLAKEADAVRERIEADYDLTWVFAVDLLEIVDRLSMRAAELRQDAADAIGSAEGYEAKALAIQSCADQRRASEEAPGALAAEMQRFRAEAERSGLSDLLENTEEAIWRAAKRGGLER